MIATRLITSCYYSRAIGAKCWSILKHRFSWGMVATEKLTRNGAFEILTSPFLKELLMQELVEDEWRRQDVRCNTRFEYKEVYFWYYYYAELIWGIFFQWLRVLFFSEVEEISPLTYRLWIIFNQAVIFFNFEKRIWHGHWIDFSLETDQIV